MFTKFRISAHKLEIERGRYIGLQTEDRICKLCRNNIEDEVHFLLECQALQTERQEVIDYLNETNKNFKNLDNCSKLVWLMSCEDNKIIKKIGHLIYNLNFRRNVLLKKYIRLILLIMVTGGSAIKFFICLHYLFIYLYRKINYKSYNCNTYICIWDSL